jgi:hypothetical protein
MALQTLEPQKIFIGVLKKISLSTQNDVSYDLGLWLEGGKSIPSDVYPTSEGLKPPEKTFEHATF